MQGCKIIVWPLLIMAFFLCECTVQHPRQHGHDQMHDVAAKIRYDSPAHSKKYVVPASVSNALLPPSTRGQCIPQKRFDVSANQIPK